MEKRLFNLYLKHIEEHFPSVWERLNKIPRNIIFYMVSMISSYALYIIALYVSQNLSESLSIIIFCASIIFLILCIVFGLLMYFSTEKYEIEVSDKTMSEYWQYCFGIRKWFLSNFFVGDPQNKDVDNEISEVKKRVDSYISEQMHIVDNRNSRIDKWVQALAIPFILAIITSILDKRETTVLAVSEILVILLIFVALFEVAWIIYSVVRVFKKQKIEQMKRFSEDLQGAMDCQKYAPDTSALNNENDTKINV